MSFYKDACVDRASAVCVFACALALRPAVRPTRVYSSYSCVCSWNDVTIHGYRSDLRSEQEAIEDEAKSQSDEQSLPRLILASSDEHFSQLFTALNFQADAPALAASVWQLLQRLPTNPALRHDLVGYAPPSAQRAR